MLSVQTNETSAKWQEEMSEVKSTKVTSVFCFAGLGVNKELYTFYDKQVGGYDNEKDVGYSTNSGEWDGYTTILGSSLHICIDKVPRKNSGSFVGL